MDNSSPAFSSWRRISDATRQSSYASRRHIVTPLLGVYDRIKRALRDKSTRKGRPSRIISINGITHLLLVVAGVTQSIGMLLFLTKYISRSFLVTLFLEVPFWLYLLFTRRKDSALWAAPYQWLVYSLLHAAKLAVLYCKVMPYLPREVSEDEEEKTGMIGIPIYLGHNFYTPSSLSLVLLITPVFYTLLMLRVSRAIFGTKFAQRVTVELLVHFDMLWHVVVDMIDAVTLFQFARLPEWLDARVVEENKDSVIFMQTLAPLLLFVPTILHAQSLPGVVKEWALPPEKDGDHIHQESSLVTQGDDSASVAVSRASPAPSIRERREPAGSASSSASLSLGHATPPARQPSMRQPSKDNGLERRRDPTRSWQSGEDGESSRQSASASAPLTAALSAASSGSRGHWKLLRVETTISSDTSISGEVLPISPAAGPLQAVNPPRELHLPPASSELPDDDSDDGDPARSPNLRRRQRMSSSPRARPAVSDGGLPLRGILSPSSSSHSKKSRARVEGSQEDTAAADSEGYVRGRLTWSPNLITEEIEPSEEDDASPSSPLSGLEVQIPLVEPATPSSGTLPSPLPSAERLRSITSQLSALSAYSFLKQRKLQAMQVQYKKRKLETVEQLMNKHTVLVARRRSAFISIFAVDAPYLFVRCGVWAVSAKVGRPHFPSLGVKNVVCLFLNVLQFTLVQMADEAASAEIERALIDYECSRLVDWSKGEKAQAQATRITRQEIKRRGRQRRSKSLGTTVPMLSIVIAFLIAFLLLRHC